MNVNSKIFAKGMHFRDLENGRVLYIVLQFKLLKLVGNWDSQENKGYIAWNITVFRAQH